MRDQRGGSQDEPEVEEAFVKTLGEAARRLYNPPPETPAEEIWKAIRAERETRGADLHTIEAAMSRRSLVRPKPWWIAAAAALVIAFGLGRITGGLDGPATGDAPTVADAGSPAGGTGGATAGRTADGKFGGAEMLPYQYATHDLIDRSETFLTMMREGEETGESADEVRRWARPLLTRTRFLLGSPAAEDPELRALLDDLEVVLVQISQLSDAGSEERGWIDEGMDENRLLFRLRAASAAGGPSSVRM
jgi:hypothetical protein